MFIFNLNESKPKQETDIGDEITTKISSISEVLVYNHESEEVEKMDMDDYLVCVVAAEMPASFELEALKAQAVSARTYTIYKSKHSGCDASDEWADICTNSAHCQAYITVDEMKENWGEDFSSNFLKVKKAVDSTMGQVIVYSGDVIEVFYHASAGGMTEDSGHVFSAQRPYLISVDSGGEQDSRNYYSTETFSLESFIVKLKNIDKNFTLDADNVKENIGEPKRYDTGRVDKIMIGNCEFSGTKLRKEFGLNSTNFTIELEGEAVVFSSIGFGHGVGMSQNGANSMAKNGYDYIDILKHYFSGVQIINDY